MFQLKTFYSMEQLIKYVKYDLDLGDTFCVYTKDNDTLDLDIDSLYWVDDYPDVDDVDNEIYPSSVSEKNLYYCYSGQQFADVINVTQAGKPDATVEDYIKALNYYSQHDTFLVL
ncbi:hypothetical protein HZY88_02240 [Aerococcaceae bacterium DSM 111176]|nr:hypothetical protein [Aerococcaceae bacterium DSM 111176]